MFPRKVIVRVLLCALLGMLPFPELEKVFYDWKLQVLKSTYFFRPDKIQLVEVSAEEFNDLRKLFATEQPIGNSKQQFTEAWREKFDSLRNQFFWDDRFYQAVLQRIFKDGPKKLLISFFFNENLIIIEKNTALQKLVRRSNILWSSQFDLDYRLMKPASQLTGTENYGFANLFPDSDGVLRQGHFLYKGHISLPFRALVDGFLSLKRDTQIDSPFLIRFTGRPGFIPTCRVSELFRNENGGTCGSLEGKYVVFAPSENALPGAGLYRTPVGYMTRGEVLSNILWTMKTESPYVPLAWILVFFAVCIHSFFLGRVLLHFDRLKAFGITLCFLAGEIAVSLVSLRFYSLSVSIVPFLVSTIFSYAVFLVHKFNLEQARRWQAEKKAEYLKEIDEYKSNFISLMSHDLKTPIAKVQALTERLFREASFLTPAHKDILNSIRMSNEELAHYIHSILDFQRIESKAVALNKKSYDINLLIDEVIHRLEPLAQDRKIIIIRDLEPMFPLEFDENLIKQVLNNLIDNAIKYNREGTEIRVLSQEIENAVEVSVMDNGVGIEPKQMERLFRKFSRSEKGTSERVKGSGLGLYLSKYFIELHGGSIHATSELGKGTVFRFQLPIAPHGHSL